MRLASGSFDARAIRRRISSALGFLLIVSSNVSRAGAQTGAGCESAPLNLIFQERPVADAPHETSELFANEALSIAAQVPQGATGKLPLYGAIVSQLEGDGAQGWCLSARATGDILFASATTGGTAAAEAPEGLLGSGFCATELFAGYAERTDWILSAVVLDFRRPVTLRLHGTATVLAFEVETLEPQGQDTLRGEVRWEGSSWGIPTEPIATCATVKGEMMLFCDLRSINVDFVSVGFVRGDANADGAVHVSDAVRILMYLFMGAPPPPCLDAADSNDDGEVAMTDAILILMDFFIPDTRIPAPGPYGCGRDPTADRLDCVPYAACPL
jgi:hypothetical protein